MKKIMAILSILVLGTGCLDNILMREKETELVCTADKRPGLVVYIQDGITGENIVDISEANIFAMDYEEVLERNIQTMAHSDAVNSFFVGAWERSDLYDVVVSAPGYQVYTEKSISVKDDLCHVELTVITVEIFPAA